MDILNNFGMYYVYCITTKSNQENDVYKIGYTKGLPLRKSNFDKSSTNLENWYYIDTIVVNDEETARKLEKKPCILLSNFLAVSSSLTTIVSI